MHEMDHGYPAYATLLGHGDMAPAREPEPMLPVGIEYTSGTTSRPTGSCTPPCQCPVSVEALRRAKPADGQQRCVSRLPPLLPRKRAELELLGTMMWVGGTVVLQPKLLGEQILGSLDETSGDARLDDPFLFQSHRDAGNPRAPLQNMGYRHQDAHGRNALERKTFATWGMTETVTHATRSDLFQDSPDMNIGIPAPGYEFAIMAPETGKCLHPSVNGDLWVRGTRGVQMFFEYYKNPEAMAK